MPTFGDWEATSLELCYDLVDYVSLHTYYDPLPQSLPTFLASSLDLDRMIEEIVATADHVGARLRSRKKLRLSVDEWNVWYQSRFPGQDSLRYDAEPSLIEDVYNVADAVVVGSLLITLLRHADRVGIACQAQLVNVIANSVVAKLTVILGGSFGAGNYALCGKAFDPRFLFAWPTARYAVMGAEQAASTLLEIMVQALKRGGHEPDAAELEELGRKVARSYEEQTDVRYAAARLWVDAIIDPVRTREVLLIALEVATRYDDGRPFQTGVLQV